MGLIKGTTVKLISKTKTGTDPFGHPIYQDIVTEVENVLIAPSSTEDITNQLSLTGKKAEYTLGIPKGDRHTWKDCQVEFFGKRWKTIGLPLEGLDHLIPLDWNRKVMVERYE